MKQLDSVKGSIAENVNYTIKRVEIVAACQFGQAKYCLTACSRKCDEPDNICFVECKTNVFRAKELKQESHAKAANAGCLRCFCT